MTMRVNADKAFFTSDTHFFHKAMVGMRKLESVEAMNNILIENWNSIVPNDGVVFLLGDVSFAGKTATMSVLEQLHGQIHLIKGNHDRVGGAEGQLHKMYDSVQDYLEVDIETAPTVRQRIVLSHYSHRVWNMHHYGTWHLFGHSHGSMEGIGKSMDVGVDTNNLYPYRYKTIHDMLSIKPVHGSDYHRRND